MLLSQGRMRPASARAPAAAIASLRRPSLSSLNSGQDETEVRSSKIRRKGVLAPQHLKAGCAQVLQNEHRIQDVVVHLIGSRPVWCAWCRLGKNEAPTGLQRVVAMSQY